MDLKLIFDGIGTEIIGIIVSLFIGAIGGGVVGYKVAIKRCSRQKQIAGDNSEQCQELHTDTKYSFQGPFAKNEKKSQYQEAGNKSKQRQVVSISTQQAQKKTCDEDDEQK